MLEMHNIFCGVVTCVFFRLCWGFMGFSAMEEGKAYVARPVSCVLIGGCFLIFEIHDQS